MQCVTRGGGREGNEQKYRRKERKSFLSLEEVNQVSLVAI